MPKILLIEDEIKLGKRMQKHFEAAGFSATLVSNGDAALSAAERDPYDFVIIDLNLPGKAGMDICLALRSGKPYVPILILTERNDVIDKVVGLELGADDYLTKPFDLRELLAKVRAILRLVGNLRSKAEDVDSRIRIGGLMLDLEKRIVIKDGRQIALTVREFDIISLMARHPGKVFSRDRLLREVWGYENKCYEHTIDTHINRLRGKIEENTARPNILLTVWGVGYKLNDSLTHKTPPLPLTVSHLSSDLPL
jgi:DNA-binding response OmpR family regulator